MTSIAGVVLDLATHELSRAVQLLAMCQDLCEVHYALVTIDIQLGQG